MRIFVTGGSGFVGGHVIERLAREHEVLALARSEKSAAVVRAFGAIPVLGSLGAVREAQLAGVDAIVHCAAFVEEWGSRAQFWEANVEGTTQLLESAQRAGVARFVHIGTEAALFDGRDLRSVDERAVPAQTAVSVLRDQGRGRATRPRRESRRLSHGLDSTALRVGTEGHERVAVDRSDAARGRVCVARRRTARDLDDARAQPRGGHRARAAQG